MDDAKTSDTATTDKPAERKIDADPAFGRGPAMKIFDAPPAEPLTAAARLRAFEDEAFGPDAVRIGGQIERGSGSRFSLLPLARRREYAAIERLVEAEQRLTAATGDLAAAQAAHDQAISDVETAEEAAKPEPKPEGEV